MKSRPVSKQIFIAFDKGIAYSERTQEILESTRVLQLDENGNPIEPQLDENGNPIVAQSNENTNQVEAAEQVQTQEATETIEVNKEG